MAPDPSSEPVEAILRDAPRMEMLGLLHSSSNHTFLTRLEVGGKSALAIYKPALGESPLWDFPQGTLYRRDVAAYRLARHLGWPSIPPTVIREKAPYGIGSLQLFIEAETGLHYLNLPERDDKVWLAVAVFDWIVNNADRKSGHCLVDLTGRPWLIDHGLTFHPDPKLRTVIWDFAGRRPTPALRVDLERAYASLQGHQALHGALSDLLSTAELAALGSRLQAALEPAWELPHPSSGWSLPWPPV